MQRFRKGKKGMQAVVLLLIFSLLLASSFANSTVSKAAVKGEKETAIKTVSLKIGKKKVTKKIYQMKQGEKKKLKVKVSPQKGKQTIRFTSSNKKVAAVNQSGYITTKKTGSARIKITVKAIKKGTKVSVKKTTWVKIKVIKAAATEQPADQSPSVTPTPSITPTPDTTISPTITPAPVVTSEPNHSKSLIVYFSCTDTTKRIAEYVQESTDADIYRIEAEVPYTAEDLNYGDSSTRATREQNDSSARPAIAGKVENMAEYQNVVIAYPIWWGQAPRIISTFLESYDFSGKTVIPICTSHSSGIGSSAINLHSLVDDSATWLDGRRFSATASKEEVVKWLEDSGIQSLLEQKKEEQAVERVFDFDTKTVTLNSGYQMPLNGIGTYSLLGDTCVSSVSEALKRGVRLIDTAYMYSNEKEVGEAVRNSGIPREEIFVITKLYPNQFSEPEKAIEQALEKLDIGYIDGRDIIGTNQRKPSKIKGLQMI